MDTKRFKGLLRAVETYSIPDLDVIEHMGYLFLSCTERQMCKVIDAYFKRGFAHYKINESGHYYISVGVSGFYSYDANLYEEHRLQTEIDADIPVYMVVIRKYIDLDSPFKTIGFYYTNDINDARKMCEEFEQTHNIICEIECKNRVFTISGLV